MRFTTTVMLRMFMPLLALLLAAPVVRGQERPADQAESVQAWLEQLNSRRFVEREAATLKLIEAGKGSIKPLVKHLPAAGPEVVARGMHVLAELALSTDGGTSDLAWNALEELAEDNAAGAIGRRAADSLIALESLRRQRARDMLVKAGAVVSDRHAHVGGVIITMVYAIEIPEEFTGNLKTIEQVKWLEEVRQVTMRGEQVTNEWLEPLAYLKELVVLEVKHSKVDDKGLKLLTRFPNLQYLSIYYSPVSDASLELIGSLKTLTEVRLFGTEVTPAGAAGLEQALMLATIDYRQGAFLGVGCQTHPDGAQISILHDESAADEAGMRSGDVIQWFNDKPVANFDDLRAAIADHPAGTAVTIKALRRGEPMQFKVKLGEWE